MPTTPPYCEDGTGAEGVERVRDGRRVLERLRLRHLGARRGEPRPCLRLEDRLPTGLGLLHPLDLALDRREQLTPLGELALDPLLLRLALHVTTCACRVRSLRSFLAPRLDLAAELTHFGEHARVLAADPLGHVEPVEEVVEALRPEDHLDGAARVAVDVERPGAALRCAPARIPRLCLRDHEMPPVRLQVGESSIFQGSNLGHLVRRLRSRLPGREVRVLPPSRGRLRLLSFQLIERSANAEPLVTTNAATAR